MVRDRPALTACPSCSAATSPITEPDRAHDRRANLQTPGAAPEREKDRKASVLLSRSHLRAFHAGPWVAAPHGGRPRAECARENGPCHPAARWRVSVSAAPGGCERPPRLEWTFAS